MSSRLAPYLITEESPKKLRKLLIKNPFLPTLYENIRAGNSLTDSIPFLDEDDPLVEFIISQLCAHGLLVKNDSGYEVKYSRVVPPKHWNEEECVHYAEGILNYARDVVVKAPSKKDGSRFGHYTGSLSEADYSSMVEKLVAVIDSYNDKPDGPIKYQTTFITKQL